MASNFLDLMITEMLSKGLSLPTFKLTSAVTSVRWMLKIFLLSIAQANGDHEEGRFLLKDETSSLMSHSRLPKDRLVRFFNA